MEIKTFEGDYDRKEFYGLMGKYFAEKQYTKEMPYLENKKSHVWFIAFENNTIIGFGSVETLENKILLSHSFVEKDYRNAGIWSAINKYRLTFANMRNKPIEVITKEEYLRDYWIKQGFEIFRKNGSYYYLRKNAYE